MPPKPLPNETARLRRVVSTPGLQYSFVSHARSEMRKDGLIEADVRRVVERGVVTWVEWKADELWHIEGRNIDGLSVRVVAAVYEDKLIVKVVTVMAL